MKKTVYLLLFVFFIACNKEQIEQTIDTDHTWTPEKIDQVILNAMGTDQVWNWVQAETDMIFAAAMHSDSIISIGFEVAGQNVSSDIGTTRWDNQKMIEKRDELINEIFALEVKSRPGLDLQEMLPFGRDNDIPNISVQITNPEIIEDLRARNDIRYIEPEGYYLQTVVTSRSGSGCGNNPNYNISPNDYNEIDPGTKESWNFETQGIPQAWNCSQGQGIGICIIDTGASDDQNNLGSEFTSGFSGGRSIQKESTLYSGYWWWASLDGPHDQCGHGTSMAGYAAAPRGTDGNATGVAYKADLLTIRAVEDVIISSSNEKNGVKYALIDAGNDSNVKIISMSIGSIFSIGKVVDGVNYAYNKGKLIMAAAGTSTSFTNWFGVIFPANLSKTTAITGVIDQSTLERCNNCHSGSAVDFCVTMQRPNGNNSIALAQYGDQPNYVGGSSAATATAAGIAALVWATDPGQSRGDILNKLTVTSQLYPNESSQYGYGNLNAAAAVCSD